MGDGPEALKWAKEVNDRRLLDVIVNLEADRVVAEAIEHHLPEERDNLISLIGQLQTSHVQTDKSLAVIFKDEGLKA